MSRMRARLELSNSLAEIERARAEEIEKKKSEETADLIDKAPIAFEKLKSKKTKKGWVYLNFFEWKSCLFTLNPS